MEPISQLATQFLEYTIRNRLGTNEEEVYAILAKLQEGIFPISSQIWNQFNQEVFRQATSWEVKKVLEVPSQWKTNHKKFAEKILISEATLFPFMGNNAFEVADYEQKIGHDIDGKNPNMGNAIRAGIGNAFDMSEQVVMAAAMTGVGLAAYTFFPSVARVLALGGGILGVIMGGKAFIRGAAQISIAEDQSTRLKGINNIANGSTLILTGILGLKWGSAKVSQWWQFIKNRTGSTSFSDYELAFAVQAMKGNPSRELLIGVLGRESQGIGRRKVVTFDKKFVDAVQNSLWAEVRALTPPPGVTYEFLASNVIPGGSGSAVTIISENKINLFQIVGRGRRQKRLFLIGTHYTPGSIDLSVNQRSNPAYWNFRISRKHDGSLKIFAQSGDNFSTLISDPAKYVVKFPFNDTSFSLSQILDNLQLWGFHYF